MVYFPNFPTTLLCAGLAASGLLAACGGGGDSALPVNTTVAGSVLKGPVDGSSVCAFKASATGKGEQLKCTTTANAGAYSIDLQYVGDVVIEASGGTYTDEATRTTKTLVDPLQVVVNVQGGSITGMVTPLTSVAYNMSRGMGGGVNSSNFGLAVAAVATQFQLGAGTNVATSNPILGSGANAYGKALQGVSQFHASGGSLGSFLTWSNPQSLQVGYTAAYNKINASSLSFTFTNPTPTPSTNPTPTPTPTTNPTPTPSSSPTVTTTGTVTKS